MASKQLLAIWDDKTLLEHTMERFIPWNKARLTVVTTAPLVEHLRETLGGV